MFSHSCAVAAALMLGTLVTRGVPPPEVVLVPPSAAPVPAATLSADEMAATVQVDTLSIPSPAELMTALGKVMQPDWTAQMRAPITTNFASRPQMALNLGGLIADGYLAVEAADAQGVKNIGRDILALAKPLGVQQDIINRGRSLTEFAENAQWEVLREELEATQNEVKIAMAENKDLELITLVTVGGWVRGTEVISGQLTAKYSEGGARLMRQPGVVGYLREKLDALPDKMRDDPAVKKTRVKLGEIEESVSFGRDAVPTADDIRKLNTLSAELVREIVRREKK